MKRSRDETMTMQDCDMGMTPPPSSLCVSMSPCKPPYVSVKRCRDRSVPIDAISRMMSAAITNARIKKHTSIGQLYDGKCKTTVACCAACQSAGKPVSKYHLETASMQYCSHCERMISDCCRRECIACCNVFCSLCSILNCDEQFDRILCFSCNQGLSS